MRDQDRLHRFLFDDFPVQGKFVTLDEAWRSVIARQDYPEPVRTVLGQAFAATALLAATLKFDGKMTLQMQGDGPLRMLVVQATDELQMRGMAKWNDDVPLPQDYASLCGEGTLTVTVETRGDRYQGIVPLGGGGFGENIEAYFRSSAQLQTRLWLAADENGAAGLLVQKMPEDEVTERDRSVDDADAWPRVEALASTIRPEELLELSERELLRRLFHEDNVRLFEADPLEFYCTCSREAIEAVLRSMGEDEIKSLAQERAKVQVRCEFCSQSYQFDRIDTESLFSEQRAPGSDSLH